MFDIKEHALYPRKYFITENGKPYKWYNGYIRLTLKQAHKKLKELRAINEKS
jgi:hypothetical protein